MIKQKPGHQKPGFFVLLTEGNEKLKTNNRHSNDLVNRNTTHGQTC
jgi:hypothetical protein